MLNCNKTCAHIFIFVNRLKVQSAKLINGVADVSREESLEP